MSQVTLITRSGTYEVPVELNETIVAIAKKHKVPWGHACQRGVCAQCRTQVVEGAEYLSEITSEESCACAKQSGPKGSDLAAKSRSSGKER